MDNRINEKTISDFISCLKLDKCRCKYLASKTGEIQFIEEYKYNKTLYNCLINLMKKYPYFSLYYAYRIKYEEGAAKTLIKTEKIAYRTLNRHLLKELYDFIPKIEKIEDFVYDKYIGGKYEYVKSRKPSPMEVIM